LPADDLVPDRLPDVPLNGTDAAPLTSLLSWQAELKAATLECSNAAADHAAVKATLKNTIKTIKTRESNAAARSSAALERRRFAWDRFLELLALASPDSAPPSPVAPPATPSLDTDHDAPMAPPETKDAGEGSDDEFRGIADDESENSETS
jgi:hypothetical protein